MLRLVSLFANETWRPCAVNFAIIGLSRRPNHLEYWTSLLQLVGLTEQGKGILELAKKRHMI
jgi:hypothetical protein